VSVQASELPQGIHAPSIDVDDKARIEPRCPAALAIHGAQPERSGCVCGVSRSFVGLTSDPHSLIAYCLNVYTECPVWRKQKALDAEMKAAA
jgi:hypothetical protein